MSAICFITNVFFLYVLLAPAFINSLRRDYLPCHHQRLDIPTKASDEETAKKYNPLNVEDVKKHIKVTSSLSVPSRCLSGSSSKDFPISFRVKWENMNIMVWMMLTYSSHAERVFSLLLNTFDCCWLNIMKYGTKQFPPRQTVDNQ